MPEIRTCEEYVIARLQNLEDYVEELKNELKYTQEFNDSIVKDFNELKDLICDISTYYEPTDNPAHIYFNGVYENYDAVLYEKLTRLVPKILNK